MWFLKKFKWIWSSKSCNRPIIKKYLPSIKYNKKLPWYAFFEIFHLKFTEIRKALEHNTIQNYLNVLKRIYRNIYIKCVSVWTSDQLESSPDSGAWGGIVRVWPTVTEIHRDDVTPPFSISWQKRSGKSSRLWQMYSIIYNSIFNRH